MPVIMWPTMLFLLIGVIGFIILMAKLFKSNPQAAVILLIVPIFVITIFVLPKFLSVASQGVPMFDGAVHAVPNLSLVATMLLAGLVIGFIILMTKLIKSNPKNAAILLIVPIALIAVFVLMFFVNIPIQRTVYEAVPNNEIPVSRDNSYSNSSSPDSSPIWSEGIENEFEADIYPSGISALKALAPRVVKNIPYVMGETGSPETIVIYSSYFGIESTEEFRQTISKLIPEIKCRIEISNTVGVGPKEVGIQFSLKNSRNGQGNNEYLLNDGESGTIQARLHRGDRILDIQTHYTNKYWVEDFSSFVNSQPNKNYIVAKSNETCMTSQEAERQAMQNANNEVGTRLLSYVNPNKLDYKDIHRSGMVVDRFIQSFDTSTGKIWREAILLDVSHAKLQHLANMISNTNREETMNWARMIFSIVGLFVLIVIAYAFLNAATKGYYSITLKIVGIVLAGIFLLLILHLS